MIIDPQTGQVRVDGWRKGVDNRRADFDIPDGTLRDGVNIDVLSSGRVRRRRGVSQAVADADAHSVFANALHMVWATPTALRMMDTTGVVTTLLNDARLAAPLSYVDVNGDIYFSNELINGVVTSAGRYTPWGIAVPTTQPMLLAPSGPYIFQVTCTFITASGEESGAPASVSVTTTDPATIVVANIPQSADSRVVATRLYATEIDGEAFFRVVDVPAGVTTYAIEGPFGGGMPLTTQFKGPPPPGQLLEYRHGVIYVASGNNVWHTMPLRYGMHDNNKAFFQFPERVTLLKAVPDGLYMAADRTVFVKGLGTDQLEQIPLGPMRAVEGAACNLPQTTDVMWFSDRGFVRGKEGGQIELLTEAQVAPDRYTRGAMGHIQYAGHQAVVAVFDNPATAGYASPDYAAGDTLRRAEQA